MAEEMSPFLPSMRIGCHDLGGIEAAYGSIDVNAVDLQHWELQVHATLVLCLGKKLMNVAQLRRGIEEMQGEAYAEATYYERWAVSMAKHFLDSGVLPQATFDARFGIGSEDEPVLFKPGDSVRVRAEDSRLRWRKPHLRTPGYIFGVEGVVERVCGSFVDPMLQAFGNVNVKQPLYRVHFVQRKVWPEYSGSETDTIEIEIFQDWLETIAAEDQPGRPLPPPSYRDACPIRWDGSWVRVHEARTKAEERAAAEEAAPKRFQHLAEVLVSALLDANVIAREELATTVERIGKSFSEEAASLGRRLAARAWLDADFKARLLADWRAAAESIGITLTSREASTELVVLENTEALHNLVVCTLCSCWPSALLGNPPAWYKSSTYRARAVREPRAVLREFGIDLPPSTQVRVHDSTAEMRYLVLPVRPRSTEGWSEERLVELITRDCLAGCGLPRAASSHL